MNKTNNESIASSDTESQKYLNDLININNSNKQTIENFKKFSILLDKIETSIKLRIKQNTNDLINIRNSIDSDIETFKTICTNTT